MVYIYIYISKAPTCTCTCTGEYVEINMEIYNQQ